MIQSIAVKDYMSASLVTFTPGMDVMNAIDVLVKNRISGAPVVDERGNLIGLLSEKDCMKVAVQAGYYEQLGGRVEDYMTKQVITVEAEASVLEVAKLFMEKGPRRYPVVEDNRLVGQISRRDVLRSLLGMNAH
ncbi:MAG: CBS domain-containing protein [Gammaproteobacteria bacterium]|nr:CBS domain-containing protein [Gammaproteobacteria bacterium]